jgi:hypothetical protein
MFATPEDVTPTPFARSLPGISSSEPPRAYLIGHLRGWEQRQFSPRNNVLLDYDATLPHFRSHGEPASSGRRVFDSNHAGGFDAPRVGSQGGSYPAAEAIQLAAVVTELQRRPPTPENVGA